MNKFRLTINALAVLVFTLAFVTIAQAQATRTWVSGVGNDADPCSRTAPCKTFSGAISKTAAGGKINCLDPGGFGAVTITKSIEIDCLQFPGGILNAGTNGVNVSTTARLGVPSGNACMEATRVSIKLSSADIIVTSARMTPGTAAFSSSDSPWNRFLGPAPERTYQATKLVVCCYC